MKCAVAFSVLFAGSVLLLGESRTPPALAEIVRMTKAGASDVSVLAYARAHRLELPEELSVVALQWLRGAGVSERVVSYMSAIDVRASGFQAAASQEGVTYSEGEQGRPGPRHPAYVSSEEDAAQPTVADQGNSGTEASGRYDSGFASDDLYPYWGYTYPGPYYVYPSVAIDQGNPFQPAHGGRGDHVAHHGQPGRHRSDGWRDRGAHGRSNGNTVAATRRPGNAGSSRGFRASSPSAARTAGRTPPAMRGSRNGSGGMSGSRSFGSAGPSMGAGAASPRAPVVARSGAGVSAPAGGRGRR